MKKIVIFGATGCIGAYTASALTSDYEVVAIGRRQSDNGFFKNIGIKYFSVDITSKKAFEKLYDEENIYAVIHFAGVMPAAMKGYTPQIYVDSVITGTLNVLNFCIKKNVNRIIFSQSRADSNYLMNKGPIPSDIVKKFPKTGDHSIYSICKNAAVDLIEHYYYQYGLKRFVLRLPTIYAYHPNPFFYVNGEKKPMAYRYLIDRAIKGEKIEIWGNPQRAKEIVYIEDAIQVVEKCLISELDGGVYNVGRGVGVTLEEQILGIVDVFANRKNKIEVKYCPEKPDARQYVNDISKTVKELGYNPQYDYKKLLIAYKEEMELQRFQQLWGTEKDYL